MEIDYIKISNVCINDLHYSDSPDFSDAFIESADYCNKEMTADQLETLNENRDYVYECIINFVYQ